MEVGARGEFKNCQRRARGERDSADRARGQLETAPRTKQVPSLECMKLARRRELERSLAVSFRIEWRKGKERRQLRVAFPLSLPANFSRCLVCDSSRNERRANSTKWRLVSGNEKWKSFECGRRFLKSSQCATVTNGTGLRWRPNQLHFSALETPTKRFARRVDLCEMDDLCGRCNLQTICTI